MFYCTAPSRSETCLQAAMEWNTPPRAGQRPRTVQIPSVSGRLTSYQMVMAFDTPPKPPSTVPTGASFLVARPVGRSVFIPSPTKVPAPTRCEEKNSAHSSKHCLGESVVALLLPRKVQVPYETHGTRPPPNRSSACENCRALKQTRPPRKSTLTPFRCLRNNSWFPRLSTLLHPRLFQSAYLPMTVRRILSLTLVQ